jgi:hypothetical protein
MTDVTFAEFVQQRFGGKLYLGSHSPNGKACLHEALNVYQGKEWSDDTSGTLDLRRLNDALWSSDDARTAAMVPLGSLVLAWPSWTPKRQQAFAKRVASETIRQIVPVALRAAADVHPDAQHQAALRAAADRCADEGTAAAAAAVWAAASAAEWAAASAHSAAEWAAAASAHSAAEAAAAAALRSAAAAAAEDAASAARWAASAARWAADEPLNAMAAILLEAEEATR